MPLFFPRISERLDRFDQTLDKIDATIERNTQAFERHEQAFQDFQLAFRQDGLRSERAFGDLAAAIADLRAESRAHTEAIQRMLDRWGEGPTPAS